MSAGIRPQADFLRQHERLLNETTLRSDVVLFLPMSRYMVTDKCRASELAAALSRANVQYSVISEDAFAGRGLPDALHGPKVLVAESRSVFNEAELQALSKWQAAGGTLVEAANKDWLSKA